MVRTGQRARRSARAPTVAVTFALTLRRDALSVPVMRRALGGILAVLGTDQDAASDVLVAVTEACTNVLRHAGPDVTWYTVQVSVGPVSCDVAVTELPDGRRGNVPLGHRLTARLGDRRGRAAGRRPPRRAPARSGLRLVHRLDHGPAWSVNNPTSEPGEPDDGQPNATVRERGSRPERDLPAGPTTGEGPVGGEAATVAASTAPAEGGRGLNLMRALVDDVTFSNSPGGRSVVTLHKRMRFADDTPLARLRDAG